MIKCPRQGRSWFLCVPMQKINKYKMGKRHEGKWRKKNIINNLERPEGTKERQGEKRANEKKVPGDR